MKNVNTIEKIWTTVHLKENVKASVSIAQEENLLNACDDKIDIKINVTQLKTKIM